VLTSGRLHVHGNGNIRATSSNEALVMVEKTELKPSRFASPTLQLDVHVAGATARGRTQATLPASFRSVNIHLVHLDTEQRFDMCISFDDGGGLPDAGMSVRDDAVGVVRCGVVWGGVVWCGVVWCGARQLTLVRIFVCGCIGSPRTMVSGSLPFCRWWCFCFSRFCCA